jgi:hypothetical protein
MHSWRPANYASGGPQAQAAISYTSQASFTINKYNIYMIKEAFLKILIGFPI